MAWELIVLVVEKVVSIVSWPVEVVVENLTIIGRVEVLVASLDKIGESEG